MTEANIVYSDVKFTKTKERIQEGTSSPDETTYSELKVSKIKSPTEPVGPQQATPNEGSKVTPYMLAIGLLTVLLTAAIIGLVFTSYSYLRTMDHLDQLTAANRNLTETCLEEPSPTTAQKTCPALVNTTNQCVDCPDGWEGFGSQCYYFSNNGSAWGEARDQCQQHGADLVRVTSRAEQEFLSNRVKQLMKRENDRFWIGLTDSQKEGTWLWVDGSPLDESLAFWISSEPDNWPEEDPVNGEDCANLGDRNRGVYCWYDRACGYPLKSICEKPGKSGHMVCALI